MLHRLYAIILFLCLISFATTAHAFSLLGGNESKSIVPKSQQQMQLSFAPVVKRTSAAVVNIYTTKKVVRKRSLFADPFFEQLFGSQFELGLPRARMENSLGSGVVINPNGQVVTSYHVVEGAQDIRIVLHDQREFNARMLRSDPQADLALLQIEAKGQIFHALSMRDSDALEVGDLVLALGNPFGVGQTVTSGIISAEGRPITAHGLQNYFIQTDAAINPGNSGGALVDMDGNLVGINTAIFSNSGGSHGIGFAIPANMLQSFLKRGVNKAGRVVKPWFGATFQPVSREIANAIGLPTPSGVLVKDLYDGSPAKKAGIRTGDIIIAAGGRKVPSIESLRYVMNTSEIGHALSVTVMRAGKKVSLQMLVIAPPESPARDTRILRGDHPFIGTTIANLNPALANELEMPYVPGAVVVLADKRYLQRKDLVATMNGVAILSAKHLQDELTKKGARRFSVTLIRGGKRVSIMVR